MRKKHANKHRDGLATYPRSIHQIMRGHGKQQNHRERTENESEREHRKKRARTERENRERKQKEKTERGRRENREENAAGKGPSMVCVVYVIFLDLVQIWQKNVI